MRAPDRLLLVLALSLVATGCASTSAPSGWLPSPVEAAQEAYGGWVEVAVPGYRIEGELIAVGVDSLYVLSPDGVLAPVATNAVLGAWIAYADNDVSETTQWGGVGTLSTLSHGFFFVFTAPVWIIATSAATAVESHAQKRAYPRDGWSAFRPYARFPQGLPAGLDRSRLGSRR